MVLGGRRLQRPRAMCGVVDNAWGHRCLQRAPPLPTTTGVGAAARGRGHCVRSPQTPTVVAGEGVGDTTGGRRDYRGVNIVQGRRGLCSTGGPALLFVPMCLCATYMPACMPTYVGRYLCAYVPTYIPPAYIPPTHLPTHYLYTCLCTFHLCTCLPAYLLPTPTYIPTQTVESGRGQMVYVCV